MDKWFACYGMAVCADGKKLGAISALDTALIDVGTMKVTRRFLGRFGDAVEFSLDSKKFSP